MSRSQLGGSLEHSRDARAALGGSAVPDHGRHIHRRSRGRAARRRFARDVRPLTDRARADRLDRRRARRSSRPAWSRCSPAPTSATCPMPAPPFPMFNGADGASRCSPPARSASSASRWPSWSPRSRYQGEDAAELVDVDYEPLPPVVDPHDAARDEALLFPEAGTNTVWTIGTTGRVTSDGDGPLRRLRGGRHPADRQPAGRAGADGDRGPPRRSGASDGRLTAGGHLDANQGAQGTKRSLAGHARHRTRSSCASSPPTSGGAFGAKFGADPEHAVVAWAASRLGRPVRWSETRSENMVGDDARPRRRCRRAPSAAAATARCSAYRLEVLQDCRRLPAHRRAAADADRA